MELSIWVECGDLIWRGDRTEVYYDPNTCVNPGECLYQCQYDIGQGWRTTSCEVDFNLYVK